MSSSADVPTGKAFSLSAAREEVRSFMLAHKLNDVY